jgi:transposase
MLMGHYRQSKRLTAMFLSSLLKVPCSTGWVCKIQNTVSQALEQPYSELQNQLQHQNQLFVDESPTKENKAKAWLWVAVASTFAVFGIFLSRKRTALKQLIGDYSGTIINCDRAKMYQDGKTLQWCWSHLKRDIQKLIDNPDGQVKRLGYDLRREQKGLFELWHRYKNGELSWVQFQKQSQPICRQFDALILRGVFSGNNKLMGMCEELYRHRDWLWTFTKVEGIEPTNNAAERALRPAVIYRKLSYGTQSPSGSRFIERMLSIIETCRLQKRSTMEYLVEVMKAHYRRTAPPSLLTRPPSEGLKQPSNPSSDMEKSQQKAA